MAVIPPALSKPEATVVTVEQTPESIESWGTCNNSINQIDSIGDSHVSLASQKCQNGYKADERAIKQDGNISDMTVGCKAGGLNITETGDKFDWCQSVERHAKSTAFTSMGDYEGKMLEDLDARTYDNHVVRLFYTLQTDFDNRTVYEGSSEDYSPPIQLGKKESWLCPLSTDTSLRFEQFYYSTVCFALDQDAEGIDYLDIGDRAVVLDPPPETDRVSFIRVLLRYQVESEINIKVFQKDDQNPGSLKVCYVELSQSPPNEDSYDCILPRIPSPRRAFQICHGIGRNSGGIQMPATVLSVEISASGSHAVTLSQVGKRVFLDFWELHLSQATSRATYPYQYTVPNAYAVVDIDTKDSWSIKLSLSWNGSQTVVYRTQQSLPGAVLVFEYPGYVHRRQSQSQQVPPLLEPSDRHSRCATLQSFGGDARFTYLSRSQWDDSSERFVTCDQKGFSVFKTTGQWEMLFHIPVLRKLSTLTDVRVASATAGGILALETSPYHLTIWDLTTRAATHLINTTHWIKKHFLSSTGQTLAIVTEKTLLLYSTESGDLLQRLDISSDDWCGFLERDKILYGQSFCQRENTFFIADTSNISQSKRNIMPLLDSRHVVQDIKIGEKRIESNAESTVVACYQGSTFEISFLEDASVGTKGEPQCAPDCISKLQKVPEIVFGTEINYPGGTFVIQVDDHDSLKKTTMNIQFKDGALRQYWWKATSCYTQERNSRLVVVNEAKYIRYLWIWRLPQSSQEGLELLFYWDQFCMNEVRKLSACSHEGNPTLSTVGGSVRLYSGKSFMPEDTKLFFESLTRLAIEKEPWDGDLGSKINYLRSFVNYYPISGDHSESLISNACSIREPKNHESVKLFLKRLLQTGTTGTADNWVPLRAYTSGANPLGIILEKARTDPTAVEIARILIEYCLEKAKESNDITYILYMLECMDDLVTRHADLALRVTRGFGYIRCHDREFVVNNYMITHPPTFRQFWTPNGRKIYECRNPVLQLHLTEEETDPLNANFTEDVFVAPVNLLWSFVPKTRSQCNEFPNPYSSRRTTWIQAFYRTTLLCISPFSHVYIQPRFYSLEILYNPAIEAVIQYKWNSFAFVVWMIRFSTQCLYSLLIVVGALMQVYHRKRAQLLGVFSGIAVLSCMFLWLEFLQWRESRYHSQLVDGEEGEKGVDEEEKKRINSYPARISQWIAGVLLKITGKSQRSYRLDPLDTPRSRSAYFRSPYNMLDLVTYSYPLITSIHQIVNIVYADENPITADFSFSVVFVFLHLLAELRVSETVCKYITIMFGILREIKVFSMVLATSMIFFTIAIVHVIHGGVESSGQPKDVNLPDDFLGAISTVYLMMGGRYDPLNNDMFVDSEGETKATYKNGPLLFMVMVYFTFSSILMLNVLIALMNSAFIKADDSWRQVWLENRLRYVEGAENMSFHIPGFRETFNWFPTMIYYTATPYQMKQYWRKVAKMDEEIIFEDEPTNQSSESMISKDNEQYTEQSWAIMSSRELEGESIKQNQTIVDGFSSIKEQLMQQAQHLNDLKRSNYESVQTSRLQQDNLELDMRISLARKETLEVKNEISEVKEELSGMKAALSETKVEVSEVKEGIVKLQSDINAILETLRGFQK